MKRIRSITAGLTVLLSLMAFTLVPSGAEGAVPQLINFQGILKDGSGNPVANGSYSVLFKIYDAPTAGNVLWSETQSVTTTNGLFNTLLGSVTPIPDTMFNDSSRYLGIKVGADPEMTPRQKLSSVGFSYVSGQWTSVDSNLFRLNGNVGVGTYFPGAKLDVQNYGSSGSILLGVQGIADNSSSGVTEGGYFAAGPSGSGSKNGVVGLALGSGSSGPIYGTYGQASNSSLATAIGAYGQGINSTGGVAYGGYFNTTSDGTGGRIGAYGEGNATTNYAMGLFGAGYNSSSVAYGVKGYGSSTFDYGYGGYFQGLGGSGATGVFASGYPYGVEAYGSSFGTGVYGEGFHGVFGYSPSGNYGVRGYADGGIGVYGDGGTAGSGAGVYGFASGGSAYAGYFSGNLLATGSKTAAVRTDNGEYHLMYAEEATENWFEDFGAAQLVKGHAIVHIDPLYAQTVNTGVTYHVFLTPEGDCRGLFVANKTPGSFEIRELQNGKSDLSVSYRIVAKRKGYENNRLAKMTGPTPEEMQAKAEKMQAEQAKLSARNAALRKQADEERAKLEQERLIQNQKLKENK